MAVGVPGFTVGLGLSKKLLISRLTAVAKRGVSYPGEPVNNKTTRVRYPLLLADRYVLIPYRRWLLGTIGATYED